MNLKRTLVYGSQTSLGSACCKAWRVPPVNKINAEHEHIQIDLRCAVGHFDQVLIVDGINYLAPIGEHDAGEREMEILRRNVFRPYDVVNRLAWMSSVPLRVVVISSQTYRIPQRCTAIYCASKAALSHMVRVMARELAPKGWIINALAPGKIEDTEMSRLTDMQVEALRGWSKDEADRYALKNVPAGRFTNRTEVCKAIEWLFKAPDYVNGTTVEMTGGA